MSRIGKKPVNVPSGVKVELTGKTLKIAGSSASLTMELHPAVKVSYDDAAKKIQIERQGDNHLDRAMHGTTRALIANMINGVTKGYARSMQIFGTGYGVKQEGKNLLLTAGTAQPFSVPIPAGIKVDIKTPNTRGNEVPAEFTVTGADKCLVGQFSSQLRKLRPPEPYKGKGIRYANEVIKRKVGKAFASGG